MATDPLTGQLVRERAVRERSRWLVLAVIGIGFAAVVTALTAINVALPSAQHEMQFTTADRQWVVTAYTLAFGSLLLAGGRLVDLFGQKTTFLVGLLGFAAVSAVGGASVNFGMLVALATGTTPRSGGRPLSPPVELSSPPCSSGGAPIRASEHFELIERPQLVLAGPLGVLYPQT